MENLSIRFSNNTPDGCLMSIYYVPGDRYACYRYVGAAISLVLWHCVFFFFASTRGADNVELRSGR